MRFELMLPHQIRRAIEVGTPVVLPLGVLEYHGEHLAVGMDTLAVTRILDRLEREMELVILPPFPYGAASYAVAGPAGTGTLHIDAGAFQPFAEKMFTGLLRIGFRNIHGFVHHQTENFAAGMPTDLAFRFAARQAVFRFLESERGEGWWGRNDMRDYYASHDAGADPFNWIAIHPLMPEEIIRQFPTSLIMELAPEAVEVARLADNTGWFTDSAREASVDLGRRGVGLILDRMRSVLGDHR